MCFHCLSERTNIFSYNEFILLCFEVFMSDDVVFFEEYKKNGRGVSDPSATEPVKVVKLSEKLRKSIPNGLKEQLRNQMRKEHGL